MQVQPTGETRRWKEELKLRFQGPGVAWEWTAGLPWFSAFSSTKICPAVFKYQAFNDYHNKCIWLGFPKMEKEITPKHLWWCFPLETSCQREIHHDTGNSRYSSNRPSAGEKDYEARISPWGREMKTTVSLSHHSSSQKLSKSSSE